MPEQYYVRRPGDFEYVKDLLLDSGSKDRVAISGAQTYSIQGMGGVGKTLLAAEIARDGDVQRAFHDGVYWLTVSQEPDVTALQTTLLRRVSGDHAASVSDVEDGREKLADALMGKRCLVVLDDVWRFSDVRALDMLDRPGRLLVTTRDDRIRLLVNWGIVARGRWSPKPPRPCCARAATRTTRTWHRWQT